jgi:hypothetical protein
MNNLYAAGIIPFVKINSTVFYLLGKEKSNGKWSGFVGNSKEEDLSIPITAIREFNEETCGVFSEYLITINRIVHKTSPVVIKKNKKNIYIYFIEFPFYFLNNEINIKFNNFHNILKSPEYLEKDNISWFTKNSILTNNNVLHSLKNIIKEINNVSIT